MTQPYFNADTLPVPQDAYVAWIDVMGVQGMMQRSLSISANFVCKFHVSVLNAVQPPTRVYPVMDGVYVVSESQTDIIRFIQTVFSDLAYLFVSTPDMRHRFLIKGALAYGPIIHGRDIPQQASKELHAKSTYRDALLIGMPMIQSHVGEKQAPPFGVFVNESARGFAPASETPLKQVWWKWWHQQHVELAQNLRTELKQYFDWCAGRAPRILYPADRIPVHKKMAEQYLIDA